MKQFGFLLIGCLILFIYSCRNDFQVIQQQYFPDQVGDSWTYRLSGINSGTIQVMIVGRGKLPNGDTASLWQYMYRFTNQTSIDTVWVSITGINVRIFDNPRFATPGTMPFEKMHYILPLQVVNLWHTNDLYRDTIWVLKQLTVNVPSGTYENVYQLSKVRGHIVNTWTNDTIYFKEQIGLVKISQHEFNLGPVLGNGVWELESYDIQ
jgi:hypothetical protein